jgi:hypothetical protein
MYQEPDFKSYDYVIGGKLVVGRAVIDETYQQLMMSDKEARQKVKEKLVTDMAHYMLENNLVEFMQQQNPMDLTTTVLVRAYIAPNDQVKILRLANKIV